MWALKTLLKEARVIVGLNYSGGDLAADQDGLIEVADKDLQTQGRGQESWIPLGRYRLRPAHSLKVNMFPPNVSLRSTKTSIPNLRPYKISQIKRLIYMS